jgi:hypothetical protein
LQPTQAESTMWKTEMSNRIKYQASPSCLRQVSRWSFLSGQKGYTPLKIVYMPACMAGRTINACNYPSNLMICNPDNKV